ncbi:MAG: hypothetical protein FJ387_18310 [Verrucomicrobia bacterium]|nr:hypothetical protein [Verrucomicrobiota bacterium]
MKGRIGPPLLTDGCQAHFINMPARLFLEEHPHPHGSESIIYTVRGCGALCSRDHRHLMKPGTLFRLSARISTGYEVPSPRTPLS